MNKQMIQEKTQTFLTQEFLFEFDGQLISSHTNLFVVGVLDSFGFVQLITFLEETYQIKFTDEELLGNQLNSLSNMVEIVSRKTGVF